MNNWLIVGRKLDVDCRAGEDRKKSDLDQRSRSHMRSRSKIKMTQDHLIDLDHRQDQRSRS